MKIKTKIHPKTRRGLSSIVGALIFVVLMVATFSVLGIALNTQTEIVDTNREVANTEVKKVQEKFSISVFTNATQHLTVNVDNVGQNPVEIFTLIITNQTGPSAELANFPTKVHNIPSDTSTVPSGHKENIVETTPLVLDLAVNPGEIEFYHFKAISALGTIKTVNLSCSDTACGAVSSGGGDLVASLFLDGPNGINGQISTAVMFVSNTYDETITDVRPTEGWVPILCDDLWTNDDSGQTEDIVPAPETITGCSVWPASTVTLAPHGTALFRWDGTVNADIGSTFTLCSNVQGEHPVDGTITGNAGAPTCDLLTVIDPNDCGGCGEGGGEGGETIILIDDLLIRPSIFMTIPSPFGLGNDVKGLWGVNVANPTDQDMTISKVTIVAYPPGGNAADVVFSGIKAGSGQCEEEDIAPGIGPAPGGYWDCPRDNTVMWQNFDSPLLLRANSTESFMLKVEPSNIFVENQNLDALVVQANVYSTFGSFGKSGYQSTMYDNESSVVNVYITDAADIRTGFIGNVNDIANYTSVTFNAVLADLDDNDETYINSGAKFIINVPREWTFEEILSCDGFDAVIDGDCDDANAPTVTLHSDGSTQIIGTSIVPIGDGTTPATDAEDARKITFKAISAPVKTPRLYIMYILADGIITTAEGDRTIGPLSEIVLNVDPPP